MIAETAFAHEGDASYLERLTDQLIKSSACVVKFQVLISPEYMSDHPMAEKCHNLMLDKKVWLELINKVRASGKEVLILPVDFCALQWVVSENLADILEIHSVNLFRRDFFEYLKKTNPKVEIILSVSGYALDQIDYIVKQYRELPVSKLSLMFGFQSFPTRPENLALGRIHVLRERLGLPIGYADHTAWDEDSTCLLATSVALGATTIEKHVVLEAGQERIDFHSAVDTLTLDMLTETARSMASAIGDSSQYIVSKAEYNYGNRRLRLITRERIEVGEKIEPPKVGYFWSSASTIRAPSDLFRLIGSDADSIVPRGELLA